MEVNYRGEGADTAGLYWAWHRSAASGWCGQGGGHMSEVLSTVKFVSYVPEITRN